MQPTTYQRTQRINTQPLLIEYIEENKIQKDYLIHFHKKNATVCQIKLPMMMYALFGHETLLSDMYALCRLLDIDFDTIYTLSIKRDEHLTIHKFNEPGKPRDFYGFYDEGLIRHIASEDFRPRGDILSQQ